MSVQTSHRAQIQPSFYEQLLDLSPDAIFVRGMDNTVSYWSAGAERLYGYSRLEAVGQNVDQLLKRNLGDDAGVPDTQLRSIGSWEGISLDIDKNGRPRTVSTRRVIRPSFVVGEFEVVETNIDVALRYSDDQALRRSELRYKSIYRTRGVAFLELDIGRIKPAALLEDQMEPAAVPALADRVQFVDTNDFALRLLAAESPEALRSGIGRVLPFSFFKSVAEWLTIPMCPKPPLVLEVPISTMKGEAATVVASVSIPYGFDNPDIILVIFIDVTARKAAEEALLTAQRRLGQVARVAVVGELAATIAHEVNQPLNAIVANGDTAMRFLNREEPKIADARAAVERLTENAHRASAVVNRIRNLLVKGSSTRTDVDMEELVNETINLLKRETDAAGIQFVVDVDTEIPKVPADRNELAQVLINLGVNAIHAMKTVKRNQHHLAIKIGQTNDFHVAVVVRDTGSGVPLSDLAQVFDALFSTKPDGMGMGLAICRSAIESHGGKIWIQNSPGGGAEVTFTLPIYREEFSAEKADQILQLDGSQFAH